jgi:5-methyltetrahydropteroyltriglutamate--homocysteine methyltransferase
MSAKGESRIRTTHTGSLPRPDDLAKKIYDREGGLQVEGFDERVRSAVNDIVKRQAEIGLDVVNDGEQGKVSYSTYVRERLTGFEGEDSMFAPPDIAAHPDFAERMAALMSSLRMRNPACTGEVRRRDHESAHRDIDNLKAAGAAAGADQLFMTAASPGVVTLFFQNQFYPSREAYLAAVADAMREEYRAIADAGIVLQLDCPDLSGVAGTGDVTVDDARRQVAEGVEALNHAVQDIPPEQMRIHVCWGNYEGPHEFDVELREIIDLLLAARPAGLSIEACNPRHAHEWEVFQDVKVPEGKYLIPGVIDSTNNYVEHPRLVAQRLLNYARLVGPERVMASSDCGFGTFAGMGVVVPSVTWAKFHSMVEGTRLANDRLGRG